MGIALCSAVVWNSRFDLSLLIAPAIRKLNEMKSQSEMQFRRKKVGWIIREFFWDYLESKLIYPSHSMWQSVFFGLN